jgi:hypothetical protein
MMFVWLQFNFHDATRLISYRDRMSGFTVSEQKNYQHYDLGCTVPTVSSSIIITSSIFLHVMIKDVWILYSLPHRCID